MKQAIIDEIKKDISRLKLVVDKLAIVWPGNDIDIFTVLLQNLAFNGKGCHGYEAEKEYQRMLDIQKALEAMKEYNNYHIISFICSEVEMAFSSNITLYAMEEDDLYVPDTL